MKTAAVLSALSLGLLSACGTDSTSATGTQGGSGGSDEGASEGDDGGDGAGTAGGSGDNGGDAADEETGEPEDLPPPPATGIEIIEVTVDQGIRVPVARNGAIVPGNERNQAILSGRPAGVRAFYDVDPGYEGRTIYGLLTVIQDDGTESTYESFTNTSEMPCDQEWVYDCRYGSASGSFLWRVFPEDMQPNARYNIELLETAPGHEDDVSDKSHIFPTDGSDLYIGIEDQYMKMRVVVVPLYHDVGADCPEAPDLNEEFGVDFRGEPRTVANYFGERLLAHNPVDEVEIIVHDVVNFTGDMQTFQPASMLQQLRFEEGAPPEYFYYGVGRPCQGGPDFAGIASLGGPTKGQAGSRIGWGVYYSNVGTTADTFVHEIGHEQGRSHIACNGQEAGVDASYPDHPDGDTESFGMDAVADPMSIKPQSAHDYMTYCGSTWVSEWAWNKVFPWIAEISSWELESAPQDSPGRQARVMYGSVDSEGQVHNTFVVDGWIDDDQLSSEASVRFGRGGALVAEQPAKWSQWEHTDGYNFQVEVPADFETIETLELESPTFHIELDRGAVETIAAVDFTLK